jgi:ABC-type transport system substrate-binding protein
MLVISAFPVKAWVYPDGTEDSRFELCGPHVSGILIKLYVDHNFELTAMNNDQLDFEDWSLTTEWVETWKNDPRFTLKNYGGDAGFYILDINKNGDPTLPDETPNPAYIAGLGNPCTVLSFRQALAYLVNRSYIVNNITQGFGLPIWTPVPAYMTTYVHSDIRPGGAFENLTYGSISGDLSLAEQYLTEDGFLYVPAEYPWRFWDKNENGHYDVGEEFTIIFYARNDMSDRREFANDYVVKLTNEPIKIKVDYRPSTREVCSSEVIGNKNFHIYTGGWIYVGPNPEYLYDLYHSLMYWHPGKPPNYGDGYDALLDQYAEQVEFAPNVTYAIQMTYKFQERFATLAWSVPLWCNSGMKAYRRVPVEEPGPAAWKGVVNEAGFGVNSRWTFLNLMKECEYYPPIYATYGFATSTIDWLNPLYSSWYWEWEVLNKIYDSCAARDPYNSGSFVPQLTSNWEISTWADPLTHTKYTKLRITLRPDLYWQDGTPLTIDDLAYTFVECPTAMAEKGLIPVWWFPIFPYFKDFRIVDPLNIEMLLNVESVWSAYWILSATVIPKHVWKPLVDASTPEGNLVHQPQPDPNCIGSGAFRFAEYVPEDHLLLVANTPSSVVHGITSPGYWQYCPIQVSVEPMGLWFKFDVGYPNTSMPLDFSVRLHNLWLNQSKNGILVASKYVYVDNNLIAEAHDIALPSCTPEIENFNAALERGKHEIKVAVHIDGPSMLDSEHPNPFTCQWINVTVPIWITITQDVGGATYKGKTVAPDAKVDGKDIAFSTSEFNTAPGIKRWNGGIADITKDYKVDGKDIAGIAKYYDR